MPRNVCDARTHYLPLRDVPRTGQHSINGRVMDRAGPSKTNKTHWAPRFSVSATATTAIVMTLVALLLFLIAWVSVLARSSPSLQIPLGVSGSLESGPKISKAFQQSWGSYAPYFPAGKYATPGDGGVVNQVNVIQRHGARYVGSGSLTNGMEFEILCDIDILPAVRSSL